MSKLSRAVIAVLTAGLGALALASPALAERPGFYSAPEKPIGEPKVGVLLLGGNGAFKCDPKCEPAGPEPSKSGVFYQWLQCTGPHGGGKESPAGGLPDEGGPCPGAVVIQPRSTAANANRYLLRESDAGKYIQVEVIAVNYDCGVPNYQTGQQECKYVEGHGWSSTLGPIEGGGPPPPPPPPPAEPPRYTELPAITGTATDGQELTVSNGTWTGTDPIEYTYQWLRCSAALKGCAEIEGATAATYKIVTADVGARLTSMVTATNAGGLFRAAAKLTAKVTKTTTTQQPTGAGTVTVGQLNEDSTLKIKGVFFSPKGVAEGGKLVVRVTVTDGRGNLVKGVEVFVAGPRGDLGSAQAVTNGKGVAILRLTADTTIKRTKLVLTIVVSHPEHEDVAALKRITVPVVAAKRK